MTCLTLLLAVSVGALQEEDRISSLIERLGSESPEERAQAATELEKIGQPALPALRKATTDANPDRSAEANSLLSKVLFVTRGWIAFYGEDPQPKHPMGRRAVYVVDPDEGKPRKVLGSIYSSYCDEIHWMPGSPRIVAAADIPQEERFGEGCFPKLWEADARDASEICLVGEGSPAEFSISPDGKRIAYIAYAGGGGSNLWVVDSDGKNHRALTKDCWKAWEPLWSPDGKEIWFRAGLRKDGKALTDSWGYYRIAADGTGREKILKFYSYPTFLPDGKRWLVLQYDWPEEPKKVLIVDLATKAEKEIARDADREQAPRLSPDGSRVLYVRAKVNEIFVVDVEGKERRRLANGTRPTWSKDETQMAFERAGAIYLYDFVSNKEKRLCDGSRPSWSR